METLPLPVIGWLFTVACTAALLLGAYLVIGLHLQGEVARRQLARSVAHDTVLFGIWILGLAVCGATIYTLRGEEALRLLSGG